MSYRAANTGIAVLMAYSFVLTVTNIGMVQYSGVRQVSGKLNVVGTVIIGKSAQKVINSLYHY